MNNSVENATNCDRSAIPEANAAIPEARDRLSYATKHDRYPLSANYSQTRLGDLLAPLTDI